MNYWSNQIDSLSQVNMDELELKDIKCILRTGRAIKSGSKTGYRHGVATLVGDIEQKIWIVMIEMIAERRGEKKLLENLLGWERTQNYTKQSEEMVRIQAMILYSGQFMDRPEWVDYIPFNKKFRPEVLEKAHIVRVRMECCPDNIGEVTREQINHAYGGTIRCPFCGRWSQFISITSG